MAFTRFTKNVLNVSALPDRVQNQAQALKATFDQAGVDIKLALNALIAELEASTSASNIGADISSVTTKTVQAILTAFETAIANRYTKTEIDTLLLSGTNSLVADVDVNLTTGVITVTKKDGTVETFDTALEKVPATFTIVENSGAYYLKITNVDGTSTQTDITSLMNIYEFNNSDDVAFSVSGIGNEKTVTASIRANSIGLDKLSLSAVSTLEGYMNSAADSASAAATSETNAKSSETVAATQAGIASEAATTATNKANEATTGATTATSKASEASTSATEAKSWAVGGTGSRTGEDTNNAKYWAEQARDSSQGGDMTKAIYDTDGDGIVDDAEKLGGQLPSYYAKATDLQNKTDKTYVDDQISEVNTLLGEKATSKNFTATIPTTGWSSSAPYTNTVTVSGILASDSNFPVSPVYSDTLSTRTAQLEAWGKVTMIVAGDNSITVTCDEEIPTTAIPIQITVVR